MEKYRDRYENPQWDPLYLDPVVELSEDNSKASITKPHPKWVNLFCDAIHTRKAHAIRLWGTEWPSVGLFQAPSKEALHRLLDPPKQSLSAVCHLYPGWAACATTMLLICKPGVGKPASSQRFECNKNKMLKLLGSNLEITMRLHIDAAKQIIGWELDGQMIGETPLPRASSNHPIFLVYQTTQCTYVAAYTPAVQVFAIEPTKFSAKSMNTLE